MKNKALYILLGTALLIAGILFISIKVEKLDFSPKTEVLNHENTSFPSKPKEEFAEISLTFVGDILPARAIELTMRKNGYEYPFEKIRNELSRADITFTNLESPLIGDKTTGRTTPGGTTVFRGDVDFANALKNNGIDIVSLANNHMKDQGQKGIESTLNTLDTAGLKHVGAGLQSNQAESMTVLEIDKGFSKPIKVGFLAFNDRDVVPESYHATEKQSGTNIMDIEKLKRLIVQNRPLVDVLIISMHSGTEYTKKPNQKQKDFAYTAIDMGADMVVGHHPHVLQPIEQYKGKYIYYSLGNFIFDQPWPDTKQSLLVDVTVFLKKTSENQWVIQAQKPKVTPLQIYQFQPQKAAPNGAEYTAVLGRLDFPYKLFTLDRQVLQVQIATTTLDRQKGLSGTSELPKGQGLLFVFDTPGKHGIWMKEMNYPIDIYWFDQDFRLVDKALSVKPETYPDVFYPKDDALYVLETKVGELDQLSLTQDLTGELTDIQ